MAAEERLNLPCSGLLALLPLCTDCSEDLQAIRSGVRSPFFVFFFSEVFRTAAGILFWNVLERRFGKSSKAAIWMRIWDLYHLKKTWQKPWKNVRCLFARKKARNKLEVCCRSKCQDAYRPLVRRDLWPLSDGRGGYRGSPWYDLVALKAWEQRIRVLRLCCFHPDDSLGHLHTWNIFNVCDRKKLL